MQDASYYPLGHLDGAEAGVQSTLDGQDILSSTVGSGQAWLVCLVLAKQTSSGERRHPTGASLTTGKWTTCWSSSSTSRSPSATPTRRRASSSLPCLRAEGMVLEPDEP